MKKIAILFGALLLTMSLSFAQRAPETADQIMEAAKIQAKAGHKNILVMFHASWCVWCKKMDASIEDPTCKSYFDNNFVIKHITVKETGDKVALDNPGGERMLEQYGGGESGIPYWLIFDQDGKLLADSKKRTPGQTRDEGQNVGCPATEQEVNDFIALLRKTSKLSDQDSKAVKLRFLKNAPTK